jgi:NCS1 family nucleobase:cation symporter-1
MVVDYFLIRRQTLDLAGLYRDDVYPAWNAAGFIAFGVPVALTLLSLQSPAFSWFYDFGWFTGSALGGLIYYGLGQLKAARATNLKPTV